MTKLGSSVILHNELFCVNISVSTKEYNTFLDFLFKIALLKMTYEMLSRLFKFGRWYLYSNFCPSAEQLNNFVKIVLQYGGDEKRRNENIFKIQLKYM